MRRRLVDHVWIEEVTLTNHLHEPSQLHLALEIDTDFAEASADRDHAGSTVKVKACLTT